jgi:dihydrofolate reductase
MSKVFFSIGMTLDGYIAPEGMEDLEHVDDPGNEDWMRRWTDLQAWQFDQAFTRANLGLGEGGETGRENQILEETFERTGASIMGKRMFAQGERHWPEEAPFHTPVFVLTHEVREPWERPGGTTFYFVNDGPERALERAQEAAGSRDVRIAGGAETIRQYLAAGLVDEFSIALAPIAFGGGTSLFDGLSSDGLGIEIDDVIPSKKVTHLRHVVAGA